MNCQNLIVPAFRYALGRKSYIVFDITNWIKTNVNEICYRDKLLMINEIANADERNGLGMKCDKEFWLETKTVLENSLKEE
jgi:hypothetical protein